MYRNSELLQDLIKKYKTYEKTRINLSTLQKISRKEKIEIKDLLCIFEINSNTYYRLKNEKQKYTTLSFNKYNGIKNKKIISQGKVNKNEFDKIIVRMNVKPYTLLRILGISRYNYNRMKNNSEMEVKVIDTKIKHIVDLIKIDLKYIKRYGNRYYSVSELEEICKKRKILLIQFIKYYSKNPKHYKFNKIAIERSSKGFWIGGNDNMTEDFLKENDQILRERLSKVIKKLNPVYGWKYLQEDLMQEAIFEMYRKMRKHS